MSEPYELPELDATCAWCGGAYRFEVSDARDYRRFCCGDCERDEERQWQVENEEIEGDR